MNNVWIYLNTPGTLSKYGYFKFKPFYALYNKACSPVLREMIEHITRIPA